MVPDDTIAGTEKPPPAAAGSMRNIPVFLGHAEDDDVVPIENGRKLRNIMQSQGFQVEWKEYPEGAHWINEPQGVDDIVRFMTTHMAGSGS